MTSRQPYVPRPNQNSRLNQQRVTQKSASFTIPAKPYTNRISCPARQSFYKNLEQEYNATKVTRKLFSRPTSTAHQTHQEGVEMEPIKHQAPTRKVSPVWKKNTTMRTASGMTKDCKIFTSDFIRHMTPEQSKMFIPKLTKRKCSTTRAPCETKRPNTEQMSADQPYRHRRVAKNSSAYSTNEAMSGHLKYGVFRQTHNRTKRSERMQSACRRPMSRIPVTPEHPHMRERENEKELTRLQPRVGRRMGEQGNQKLKDAPLLVFRTIDDTNHRHLHRSSVMHLDIRPRPASCQQSYSKLTSPRDEAHGNRRLYHCQSHVSPLSPNRIYSPTYRNASSDLLSSYLDSPKPNYLHMIQDRRGQRMSPPSFWNAALVNRLPLSRDSSNNRTFSPDFEFSRHEVISPYGIQPSRESCLTGRYLSRNKGTQRELTRHKTAPSNHVATHINNLNSSKLSVHREQSYRSVRLKNWLRNVAGLPFEANNCNFKPILNQKRSKPKFHSRPANNISAHHSVRTQNESVKKSVRNAHSANTPKSSCKTELTRDKHMRNIQTSDGNKSYRGVSFVRSKTCKKISSAKNGKPSNRTFMTCTCSVSPTFDTSSVRRSRSRSVSSSYRTVSPELVPPEKGITKKGLVDFARPHILCSVKESFCQTY